MQGDVEQWHTANQLQAATDQTGKWNKNHTTHIQMIDLDEINI